MTDYLDDVLDRLSPAEPADPAALDRAFTQLSARMARPVRPRYGRTLAAGAAAAVALAAVAYGVSGTGNGSGGAATAAGNASSRTLLQLAGFIRQQPTAGAGEYLKVVQFDDQHRLPVQCGPSAPIAIGSKAASAGRAPVVVTARPCAPARVTPAKCPKRGTIIIQRKGSPVVDVASCGQHQPVNQSVRIVTYRPGDVADTMTPWVRDTQTGMARSARCGAFDFSAAADPCAAGTWADPNATFLTHLGTEHAAQVAADFVAFIQRAAGAGQSASFALEWWAWTALPIVAGDNAAVANIFEGFAALAAHDSTIAATHTGSVYHVTAHSSRGVVDTMDYDTATGSISYGSTLGSTTQHSRITVSVVAASTVPASTPWQPDAGVTPVPGNPSQAPSHVPAPRH
jgi:hypothetical protein